MPKPLLCAASRQPQTASKCALLFFICFICSAGLPAGKCRAQTANASEGPLLLHILPVANGTPVVLEQPFRTPGADSVVLHTLRLYLGRFTFWSKGQIVFEEKSQYRLVDLETPNTLLQAFECPDAAQRFDSLSFDLGVDSLITVSGAMGGDLDPTKGMFWTWQSGYINAKIEGFSSKCRARGGLFELHLGGYLPPFPSVQHIGIGGWAGTPELRLDIGRFLDQVDWAGKPSIMSPGAEAVRLSKVLGGLFVRG